MDLCRLNQGKKKHNKNPLGEKKAHGKKPNEERVVPPKNRHTGASENARSIEAYSTFYNY